MRDHAHEVAADKPGLVGIAVVEFDDRHESAGRVGMVAVDLAADELPGVIERAGILAHQVDQQVGKDQSRRLALGPVCPGEFLQPEPQGILGVAQAADLGKQLFVKLKSRVGPHIRENVATNKYDNQKRADHLKIISQEVLIVADDLTGACDAAAALAPRTLVCVPPFCPPYVTAFRLSVSTESRDLPESEIVRRIESLAPLASQAQLIFKKIDSTLRGNVQAEIRAAMKAFECTTAIITPAFPDMGRTVKDGHLWMNGVITKPAGENVLDAETNEDLDHIVDEGLRRPGRVLWAGSAGLAAALARRLYGPPKPHTPPSIKGLMAFCIGSGHPATLAQQVELKLHHPDARIVPILRCQTTPAEIRQALAGAAALFITGGDTATTVLQAVGAKSIIIQNEVVTGVPWGLLSGGIFDGCPVITKSGGFGSADTLIKVATFFPCHS